MSVLQALLDERYTKQSFLAGVIQLNLVTRKSVRWLGKLC